MESTPDTVISLTIGQKLVVLESVEVVVKRVIDFGRLIRVAPSALPNPRWARSWFRRAAK